MRKKRKLDLGVHHYKYMITGVYGKERTKHIVKSCKFRTYPTYDNIYTDTYTFICGQTCEKYTTFGRETGIVLDLVGVNYSNNERKRIYYQNWAHKRCKACYQGYCTYDGKHVGEFCDVKARKGSKFCKRHLKYLVKKMDQPYLPFDICTVIMNYAY